MPEPTAVLLLPRGRDGFILRDQAEDLLAEPRVHAVGPPRIPYGAIARVPQPLIGAVAAAQARGLRLPGDPRVLVIFHPLQQPLAAMLLDRHPGCELWYGRWDRYERALDAGPRLRPRLERLHHAAATQSALTFVASGRLAELERADGRDAEVVGLAADSFPTPPLAAPAGDRPAPIAVSLGHLGRRVDWSLLRRVAEAMPELIVLLVGARHDDEGRDDPDFAACTRLPGLVWLGALGDEAAARVIACADVGIVPFAPGDFNDAGLPYRILKYARLGRRTIAPPLAGVRTWDRAVVVADGVDAWIDALRESAGARLHGDAALRSWAGEQTARRANAPLRERLARVGVIDGRAGLPSHS